MKRRFAAGPPLARMNFEAARSGPTMSCPSTTPQRSTRIGLPWPGLVETEGPFAAARARRPTYCPSAPRFS